MTIVTLTELDQREAALDTDYGKLKADIQARRAKITAEVAEIAMLDEARAEQKAAAQAKQAAVDRWNEVKGDVVKAFTQAVEQGANYCAQAEQLFAALLTHAAQQQSQFERLLAAAQAFGTATGANA